MGREALRFQCMQKLVTGFMLVTLLVVAMGVLSLQAITKDVAPEHSPG